MSEIKKIAIVGNSGAGKSTLAKALGHALGIETYSIDKIYWLPGWKLRDQSSFSSLHDKWLEKESWIIEGVGYWAEMEQRMAESDLVIFLDLPCEVCKERAAQRIEREQYTPNPDITPGCLYGDVEALQMEVIDHFHAELRPKLLKHLSRFDHEKVRIIGSLSDLEWVPSDASAAAAHRHG